MSSSCQQASRRVMIADKETTPSQMGDRSITGQLRCITYAARNEQ